jgi:hypothetical protein
MGVTWLRRALEADDLLGLDALAATEQKPGTRLQLDDAARAALAPVDRLIEKSNPKMRPVRFVSFDKTAQTNWALPWHQDRVIAVKERHDVPGFKNWSRKGGVWHCEPPISVLNDMLFVRVHLDDADQAAGAMEIAMGSHLVGHVAADQAETVAASYPSHICEAARGDVLVLDMLTLHRSLPAAKPASRRVLRIDYAAAPLPEPLAWAN